PIAFLFGSFLFDLAGRLGDWPSAWTTGAYLSLAALATGLLAGIPGLVDYLLAVPPNSSGKKRATTHMIVNVSALACFAVAWAFRERATWMPGTGTLVLEGLGLVLITWGGGMGGTLVYRNQIGIDHRYAGAGEGRGEAVEGGVAGRGKVGGAGGRADEADPCRRPAAGAGTDGRWSCRLRRPLHAPRRLARRRRAGLRHGDLPLARLAVQRPYRPGEVGPRRAADPHLPGDGVRR